MNKFHPLSHANLRHLSKIFLLLLMSGVIFSMAYVSAESFANNTSTPSKSVTLVKKITMTPKITLTPKLKPTPVVIVRKPVNIPTVFLTTATPKFTVTPNLSKDEMRLIEITGKNLPILLQRVDDSIFYLFAGQNGNTLAEYDSTREKFNSLNKEAEGLIVQQSFIPLKYDILNGTAAISDGLSLKGKGLYTTENYDSELLASPMNAGIIDGYLNSGDNRIDEGRFRLMAAKMKLYYLAPWYTIPPLPKGTSLFDWTFERATLSSKTTLWT